MRTKLVMLALGLLAAACGGNPNDPSTFPNPLPTATPTPAPPSVKTLTLYSCRGPQTVPGAHVTVDGHSYVSKDDGTFQAMMDANSNIDVTADPDRYLDRATTLSREEKVYGLGKMGLWALAVPNLGPEYERELVYHPGAHNDRLIRPQDGTYTYGFSPEILADPEVKAHLEHTLAVAEAATGSRIRFVPASSYDRAQVKFKIDPNDPNLRVNPNDPSYPGRYGGLSYLDVRNYIVVSDTIVFLDRDVALTNLPLHEAGHFLGLGHSIDRNDIMYVLQGRDFRRLNFSDAEVATWAMMHDRPQGNIWPDNSRVVGATSGESYTHVIACR